MLVIKVDCEKGKAVEVCSTFEDVEGAVARLSEAYPNQPIVIYANRLLPLSKAEGGAIE